MHTNPKIEPKPTKALHVGVFQSKAIAGDFPWEITSIGSNITRKCEALAVLGLIGYVIAPTDMLNRRIHGAYE
ncbi:hypothetical protein KIW84_013225 [Lathyrus oleraceus]|uniref:Uncharacterized protein n=1 Tax=Pisum sativum TaxID=3888 RepID=A0A9D5BJQ9_PEA|nr:hypothetical protein KIW84_013225 [Pisum sativum]